MRVTNDQLLVLILLGQRALRMVIEFACYKQSSGNICYTQLIHPLNNILNNWKTVWTYKKSTFGADGDQFKFAWRNFIEENEHLFILSTRGMNNDGNIGMHFDA